MKRNTRVSRKQPSARRCELLYVDSPVRSCIHVIAYHIVMLRDRYNEYLVLEEWIANVKPRTIRYEWHHFDGTTYYAIWRISYVYIFLHKNFYLYAWLTSRDITRANNSDIRKYLETIFRNFHCRYHLFLHIFSRFWCSRWRLTRMLLISENRIIFCTASRDRTCLGFSLVLQSKIDFSLLFLLL